MTKLPTNVKCPYSGKYQESYLKYTFMHYENISNKDA